MTAPERREVPLGEALDDEVGEAHLQRLWHGTSRRLGRQRRSALPLATAAIAAAAVLWIGYRTLVPTAEHSEPPYLTLADGSPLLALTADEAGRSIVLSDRSRATLGGGARIVPNANDAHQLTLTLERGRARFAVTPRGPRRWTIVADDVTVTVTGTIFSVEHTREHVRVAVSRGSVRVDGRGALARELRAGQSIVLRAPAPQARAVEARAPSVEEIAAPPSEPSARRSRPSWTALAERGEHAQAWRALGASGVRERARVASARELLLLADVARLSGHPREAIDPLDRLLDSYPRSSEARLAALVLGRIELHQLHRPANAARAFERALALGVPSAFDEEARASLVFARGESGDPAGARRAAEQYLRRHPEGARADRVRRWSEAH